MMPDTDPRRGMPSPQLSRDEFGRRFRDQFRDPAFDAAKADLDHIEAIAWDGYDGARKSPRTRKAGPEFADPDYDLSEDWIAARDAIAAAQARHDDASGPRRVLLINGSSRSEHTCPGEMSKSWRLLTAAKEIFDGQSAIATNVLDLARIASEYGRHIHPCKACFSTSAALCHWPCSCYPNYSLGQTQDWMNDIYPMWVEAHAILIVTPVNWYQAPSSLKLMIDRLVCADGGNPDPTSTQGKKPKLAKELELKGWPYPRHLAGRFFGLVVHGDTAGVETLRRMLADWLTSMDLVSAGHFAEIDRYIGYYEPYATSHAALDKDDAIFEEARDAARALVEAIKAKVEGKLVELGAGLRDPRPK
jgi:multimeric flavodoxin WrbA